MPKWEIFSQTTNVKVPQNARNAAAAVNAAAVNQSATWVRDTMLPSKETQQPVFEIALFCEEPTGRSCRCCHEQEDLELCRKNVEIAH